MDTPPDSQRKAWARLSTLTSFVSRICFFKARCSDSDSVNGFIVIPPAFDFTRVRLGGVKKILSTYLELFLNKRERSSTVQHKRQSHRPQSSLCDCGSHVPKCCSASYR